MEEGKVKFLGARSIPDTPLSIVFWCVCWYPVSQFGFSFSLFPLILLSFFSTYRNFHCSFIGIFFYGLIINLIK